MTVYVYVAGPLSGMPDEYLANVHRISTVSRHLMERGYCPVNPAADLIDGLVSAEPLPIAVYQRRSLELLRLLAGRRNAALYVTGSQHADGSPSGGVLREVEEANALGITVVYDMDGLMSVPDERAGAW